MFDLLIHQSHVLGLPGFPRLFDIGFPVILPTPKVFIGDDAVSLVVFAQHGQEGGTAFSGLSMHGLGESGGRS